MTLLSLREKWDNLPEKIRFIAVGIGGLGISWIFYNAIYFLNPFEENRATTSWAFGYFIAVFRQHGLHYWLTFKDSSTPYLRSLAVAYAAYSVGGVFTTVVNYVLNESVGLHYQLAWAISVGSSVGINYVLLSRFAFGTKKDESYDQTRTP